jgi:hypothetical protein|tara:strand:- start:224 stop:766 length:543 start_codon:yes stop_codon:yes gene_type:complete
MATIFNDPVTMKSGVTFDMASAATVHHKAGSITDAAISSGTNIDADKLEHLYKVGSNFGIEYDTAPSTSTTYSFQVFWAQAACTIRAFHCVMVDTGTQANTNDFDFDLKWVDAGTDTVATTLSAVVAIDTDITDNTVQDGTLSVTTLAADDGLIVEVTTPGTITGAHGMYAWAEITENAV